MVNIFTRFVKHIEIDQHITVSMRSIVRIYLYGSYRVMSTIETIRFYVSTADCRSGDMFLAKEIILRDYK